MTTRTAAAIYARISQDRSGEELGVKRQVQDCMNEAARRGWQVAEVYEDDDISAHSGKTRPAYERMLKDIEEGRRDAVLVYRMDRLHRQPKELEHFVEVCTRARVHDVAASSGDIDLAKSDGLLVARIIGAVAANSSDAQGERVRRKNLELAEAGRPHMGGSRPFGFLADKATHDPHEADIIRELAARALAGETLTSLVTWLQDSGIKTVHGKPWRTPTVRGLLTNGRIWGMRSYHGEPFARGSWDPIIPEEQGERLRRLLLDPARRTNRSARRYLLSSLLVCGKCGNRMHSAPRYDIRRYGCRTGPDFRGCGGVYIYAEMLEQFITEAVLLRLDSPAMHQALTEGDIDQEEARTLADSIHTYKKRMDDLATTWADGEISKEEWRTARNRLEAKLKNAQSSFDRLNRRDALTEYIGQGQQLREAWATLNLSRQVAIVKAVLNSVMILPATMPGRHGLDTNRVVPDWRQ